MQLIEINKTRYRKHLNIIIVGFITSLLVLSLLFGTVLISMFSTIGDVHEIAETVNSTTVEEQPSNFRYNLLGVILALFANAAAMHSMRKSYFFKEVYYVWQVKQLQNLIYRKINKIKQAANEGEPSALIILAFYYQSQVQVYELDDNTITLSTVKQKLSDVRVAIAEHNLTVDSEEFTKSLISLY